MCFSKIGVTPNIKAIIKQLNNIIYISTYFYINGLIPENVVQKILFQDIN